MSAKAPGQNSTGTGAQNSFGANSQSGILQLSQEDLKTLDVACTLHSFGHTEGPLIAKVCWDADRLDLGRVGIAPSPQRLCTGPAKEHELFQWAVARGVSRESESVVDLEDQLSHILATHKARP